jgi:hypothetical protein
MTRTITQHFLNVSGLLALGIAPTWARAPYNATVKKSDRQPAQPKASTANAASLHDPLMALPLNF